MLNKALTDARARLGATPGMTRNPDGTLSPLPVFPNNEIRAAQGVLAEAVTELKGGAQYTQAPIQGAKSLAAQRFDIVDALVNLPASATTPVQGQKTAVQDPWTLKALFDMCDATEMGLSIQPTVVTGSRLVDWIGRALANSKDRISIPLWDFRNTVPPPNLLRGTIDSILCAAPACVPSARPVGKTNIVYCFDPQVSYQCVPGYSYEAFRERCYAQGVVDILGNRYDPADPQSMIALDRALTMIALKEATVRQKVLDLLNFSALFADKHPELAATPDLLPPAPISLAPKDGATCENIANYACYISDMGKIIWNKLRQMKYCVETQFRGTLRPEDFVFVMNANDALCLMWSQVCVEAACAPGAQMTINVTPENLNDSLWALDQRFQERLTGGKYGFGYIRLPDKTRIDIMAEDFDLGNFTNPLIPQGHAYLRVSGWGGMVPNQFGLKFVEEDFSTYVAYKNSSGVMSRIRALGIGNALEFLPADGCDDRYIGFNTCLMSNIPWMQIDFVDVCGLCEEALQGNCIPPLPAVGSIALCETPNC